MTNTIDQVFVVFGDETPFPGLSGSATYRKILAVTDTVEKARDLVRRFEKKQDLRICGF